MKTRRQRAILDLVSQQRVASQLEIRERLAQLGVEATQSTISRDIEELGLVKIHDPGGLRYVTPEALNGGASGNGTTGNGGSGAGPKPALKRLLQEYVSGMTPSGNLLLVHTPPGAAHLLAEGIDTSGLDEIAGTVAGDNTILVVAKEGLPASRIAAALQSIMEEGQ